MLIPPCDCGIFLIAATQAWLCGNSMPREKDMAQYRLEWIDRLGANYTNWRSMAPPFTPGPSTAREHDIPNTARKNDIPSTARENDFLSTAREDDFLSTAPANDFSSTAPWNDINDDDEEEVIFMGQQTRSSLSSVPRRSSRRPKEKCTRCKRSGDACDLNSPCASCTNAGASEQCYHLSDHDKTVLHLLQQQYGAPCVACGVRDFCDRESPCGCCEHLGLECKYHPGAGKKAKSLPGSYISPSSRNFVVDPRFAIDPRAMSFTMPSPVVPLQLGSTKRKCGATLLRERPNLEHESGLDGKDILVNSAKRKRGAVISSKHHNLEHESGDNSGTFVDETDSGTTSRRSTDSADSADSADSTSPITIGCPANRYSKVANCPERLPPPTTRANVRIVREHVHESHPYFTMNVGHFTCKYLKKIMPLGYLYKEISCSDHDCIALILPPHPRAAHVNEGTWFPGKDLVKSILGGNSPPAWLLKVAMFINWFRQSSTSRPKLLEGQPAVEFQAHRSCVDLSELFQVDINGPALYATSCESHFILTSTGKTPPVHLKRTHKDPEHFFRIFEIATRCIEKLNRAIQDSHVLSV